MESVTYSMRLVLNETSRCLISAVDVSFMVTFGRLFNKIQSNIDTKNSNYIAKMFT